MDDVLRRIAAVLFLVGFSHGRVICDSTGSYCDDGWDCCHISKCCRYTYTGGSSSSGSSNGGAIAGIVIGSIFGLVIVILFCAGVITFCKNRSGTVHRATVNPARQAVLPNPAVQPITQIQQLGARDVAAGPAMG